MSGIALFPLIISLSVFVAVFCIVWACMALFSNFSVRRAVMEKVRSETSSDFHLTDPDERLEKGDRFMRLFGKIGSRYADENTPKYSVLRLQFLQAGIRNRMAIPAFWGVKIALMAALPLVFLTFRVASIIGVSDNISALAICCALALAGSYIPDVWLRFVISARKTRIRRCLPDALDMLVVCVEAGLGLDAAIHRVADEIKMTCPDLSDEFRLYALEMRAGTGREDALNNLTRRTDLDEVQSLASLLIQTDRFGTSLSQGLRVYAESFRSKRFMRAEERAATLPTKLMIPLIFCIFPALLVVIALPAVLRIYNAFNATGN